MRIFLIFCLLTICAAQMCLAHDYVVPYDNALITAASWEEIDITWPNPFNPKIPNSAKLLRPTAYAHEHNLMVGKQVYLDLTELGVPKARITVTRIKSLKKVKINQLFRGKNPVIGFYVHQTINVRTYQFKDSQGRIIRLHATPTHPFYVANLHTYLPIRQITAMMALEGKQHQPVYLVCHNRLHRHCGIPYQPGKVITVYNLEVYQQHMFRVTRALIRVHNSQTITRRTRADAISPSANPRPQGPGAIPQPVVSDNVMVTNPRYGTVPTPSSSANPRPQGPGAIPQPVVSDNVMVTNPRYGTVPTPSSSANPRPQGPGAISQPALGDNVMVRNPHYQSTMVNQDALQQIEAEIGVSSHSSNLSNELSESYEGANRGQNTIPRGGDGYFGNRVSMLRRTRDDIAR